MHRRWQVGYVFCCFRCQLGDKRIPQKSAVEQDDVVHPSSTVTSMPSSVPTTTEPIHHHPNSSLARGRASSMSGKTHIKSNQQGRNREGIYLSSIPVGQNPASLLPQPSLCGSSDSRVLQRHFQSWKEKSCSALSLSLSAPHSAQGELDQDKSSQGFNSSCTRHLPSLQRVHCMSKWKSPLGGFWLATTRYVIEWSQWVSLSGKPTARNST